MLIKSYHNQLSGRSPISKTNTFVHRKTRENFGRPPVAMPPKLSVRAAHSAGSLRGAAAPVAQPAAPPALPPTRRLPFRRGRWRSRRDARRWLALCLHLPSPQPPRGRRHTGLRLSAAPAAAGNLRLRGGRWPGCSGQRARPGPPPLQPLTMDGVSALGAGAWPSGLTAACACREVRIGRLRF